MFDFTVNPDNGQAFTVTAGTRDVLQWERTTKGAVFSNIATSMRITDMYKLAWLAAVRLRLFTGNLDEFETTCELEFVESDEPDPTLPAR